MQTIIVTGLSGAGKTRAIQILEDAGFFCVDNVPFYLVHTFINLCKAGDSEITHLALVADIRGYFRGGEQNIIQKPDDVKALFLEADTRTLINRYQTSRRQHPLAERAGSLSKSLEMEKKLLAPIRQQSDWIIDTSDLDVKALRRRIMKIIRDEESDEQIRLTFSSFGFKYGIPMTSDFVFDTRFLPNPFYKAELREMTGEDAAVREYVMGSDVAQTFFEQTAQLLKTVIPEYTAVGKNHIEIAFGCTGGQHRSVTFARLMAERFQTAGYDVRIEHRELEKES